MTLIADIETAWKTAMKARDPKKDVLSLMRTEVKNKAIAARTKGVETTELPDDVVISTLSKMCRQRTESIEEYGKAGRDDLAQKEKFELCVIEEYLPKQLSADELNALVKAAIAESGATTAKDMSRAMKTAMGKVAGRADGRLVQAAVKALLP